MDENDKNGILNTIMCISFVSDYRKIQSLANPLGDLINNIDL